MVDKPLNTSLIPEFNGDETDQPVIEWIEHVELNCELCKITKMKQVVLLYLRRGVLVVYRQQKKAEG